MQYSDSEISQLSRRLRNAVEPISSNVYFAEEAQEEYRALGLDDYSVSYFTSRSACMGRVPGQVTVSAFGVFRMETVVPAVEEGWSKTDPEPVLAARERGAVRSLQNILGEHPEGIERAVTLLKRGADAAEPAGHPIYCGLLSLGLPGYPLGDLWRTADLVREHRGDSHVAAWTSHRVDQVEINLLSDLWSGLRLASFSRTRGWTKEQLDAGIARLEAKGLVVDGQFTAAGRELRRSIEVQTDLMERPVIEAIGDDLDELFDIIEPWARAIVESGGYPVDPKKVVPESDELSTG